MAKQRTSEKERQEEGNRGGRVSGRRHERAHEQTIERAGRHLLGHIGSGAPPPRAGALRALLLGS